jgi:phenylacetic acid degradation operon negative regulatory protein
LGVVSNLVLDRAKAPPEPVEHEISAGPRRPRAVLFDLFGDHLRHHGGRVGTPTLVALLGVLGIPEASARSALVRMRREGWLASARAGRTVQWALTPRAVALLDEGRERIFEWRTPVWDGCWRMVIFHVPERDREQRHRARRILAWFGFGPLAGGTWISPHDRLEEVAAALAERTAAARVDLFTGTTAGPGADRDLVERCWDLRGLAQDYRGFLARLDHLPPPARLERLAGADALRLQIDLVAHYRQFPFRDPNLPAELLPEDWPGAAAHRAFREAHDALAGPAGHFVAQVLAEQVG